MLENWKTREQKKNKQLFWVVYVLLFHFFKKK